MNTESGMIKCLRPGCGIHFNPKTSSEACPHKWAGRATPRLDELAAKLRRGERIKSEPWNPADHTHTVDLSPTSVEDHRFQWLRRGIEDAAAGRITPMSAVDPTL